MNKGRINALIARYLKGTGNQEETTWVNRWLDERSRQSGWNWKDEKHKAAIKKEILNKIAEEAPGGVSARLHWWTRTAQVAAAVLLLAGLAISYWFLGANKKNTNVYAAHKAVKPGTKAATLQIGDGEIIYLDDKAAGVLSQSNDVSISKMAGGIIQYHALEKASSDKVLENTLSIPRGGQYQITLSDGTKVWLNSETKLIYPNHFVGKERKVKVIGEAYFEVAKNVDQPFIVHSTGMDVRVTGTAFNVATYEDAAESTTTLIEGRVEIHSQGKLNTKLIPGQQAYRRAGESEIGKREVDVNKIVSWRKGYFSFDNQNLEEIMNEISRWYDIDYKVVGQPKNPEKLGGTFSRGKSIDELFAYLEQLDNVKIVRKERSVTIMY